MCILSGVEFKCVYLFGKPERRMLTQQMAIR